MSTGYPYPQQQPYPQQPQPQQGDPSFNWATGQPTGGAPADQHAAADAECDDFVVGAASYDKDADAIEQERAYRLPPPGEHEFVVTGFLKKPELVSKTGYINGQQVSWTAYKIGVRLALVSDPGATVLDFFEAPPNNPQELYAYTHASKESDGKNPGFHAEKFGHFVARLGFAFAKGQPIPVEATRLGNWRGRRIVCSIEHKTKQPIDPVTGDPKLNPATFEPLPPRTQAEVKLFSYKLAGSAVAAMPAAQPQPMPQARPAQVQPQPQPQAMYQQPAPPPGYAPQPYQQPQPQPQASKLSGLHGRL